MKLTSQTTQVDALADVFEREFARVDALVQDHARIGAQLPIQLPGADIHGMHARRAGLQQARR